MSSTILLTVFVSCVLAQSATDPSMADDPSMGGMMTGGGMVPWLHFDLGDNLWFSSWVPTTNGTLTGAAVGLFLLAIVDRWIAGIRGVMEMYWNQRTAALVANRFSPLTDSSSDIEKESPSVKEANIAVLLSQIPKPMSRSMLAQLRATAPFVPSHDVVRGIFQVIQAALGFTFMLAIMTFQGAYFIAVVLGLGFGETLFGRYATFGRWGH